MKAYFTRLVTWVLGLATLGGCYLAAVAVSKEWAFWVALVVAAALAGARPVLRSVGTVLLRYRAYPALAADRIKLGAELKLSENHIEELESFASDEYRRGLHDGHARLVGAVLSKQMQSMPTITALTVVDGAVALVASYVGQPPPLGAWLRVEVVGTGEVKGAVQVVRILTEEGTVILKCSEKTSPIYWEKLFARLQEEDPAPPRSVRLRAYRMNQPVDQPVVSAEKSAADIEEM